MVECADKNLMNMEYNNWLGIGLFDAKEYAVVQKDTHPRCHILGKMEERDGDYITMRLLYPTLLPPENIFSKQPGTAGRFIRVESKYVEIFDHKKHRVPVWCFTREGGLYEAIIQDFYRAHRNLYVDIGDDIERFTRINYFSHGQYENTITERIPKGIHTAVATGRGNING